MRKLTVKRTKSFVGCLGKMKVYIEDSEHGELKINNISCRKLGTLKNGEEKTFEIENSAAKVFVIADKLSKNYCNEFYALPEGEEDVFLSGKNRYNPFVGNPFRFDNNENTDALQNRKKNNRKGLIILVISIVVGFIIGSAIGVATVIIKNRPQPQTFSSNGMSIVLTDRFEEYEDPSFTAAYASEYVAVFAIKESFSLFPELKNITLAEYGELCASQIEDVSLQTKGELTYFSYTTEIDENESYHYTAFIYQTDDAFWLIQFSSPTEIAQNYQTEVFEWAQSITFDQ